MGLVAIRREERSRLSHRAELTSLYLDAEARGTGLAGRLLDAALDHAMRRQGVVRVGLSVSASNTSAIRLYESRSFRIWGVEPGSVIGEEGSYEDEVHMVHVLGKT